MKQAALYSFLILMLGSCMQRSGSGNIVTEKRQTGNFTGVSVGGSFEVELKNGPVTEVVVESDDNIIKYIETRVSGGELRISTKEGAGFSNAHFKVFVSSPEINSIKTSGASNLKATSPLKDVGKISLDVSGASEITATVDAPEIYAEVTGASKMNLEGRTRNYKAKVSGSGELKSDNLLSEHTEVKASGAGSAKVHASVNLKAEANGAGHISYKGGASVQQKTHGAGNVKKED